MTKNNDSAISDLYLNNPWKNNPNKTWLATTLNIYRNVDKFNFPNRLTTETQKAIIHLVSGPLLQYSSLQTPKLILAEMADPFDKEYLAEHFLFSEGFYRLHSGEAFIIDKTGMFLATINFNDHLHLTALDCSGNLEEKWNALVKIETTVGESIRYAFSQRFGFLTADPTLCGTGIEIAVFLQLPALIHTDAIDETLDQLLDDSITISGLYGSPTEIIGDVLILKNNYTLGTTDETILSLIENVTTKLTIEENSQRSKIRSSGDIEIKDRVSRAYGILMHSYQIDAIEALNALSLIKLGLDLQWITGSTQEELNALFFNCRRAHLMGQFDNEVPQEELSHKRAEYIHKSLKMVQLNI